MLYTISWMVRREPAARQSATEREILVAFLLGGLVGGAVAGAMIAALARGIYDLVGRPVLLSASAGAVLAAAFAGSNIGLWSLSTPQLRSQVPAAWREIFRPRLASFLYSAGLGLFLFTRLGSAVALPLTVCALGLGYQPFAVILTFTSAGLVRAITGLAVPLGRIESDGDVRKVMARFGPLASRVDTAALLLVAVMSGLAAVYR